MVDGRIMEQNVYKYIIVNDPHLPEKATAFRVETYT